MDQVDIILATYNGEKYISRQLDSILNQNYENIKCLIHDDGSSDSTRSILKEYEKKYPERIKILNYKPTGSACKNFMSMLQYSDAEYIMFSDQDDYWMPNKVSTMITDIKKYESEKPCAVFCNLKIVDDSLNVISDDYMGYSGFNTNYLDKKFFMLENIAPGCAMIINKKLKEIALMYDNINNIDMHDWWCMELASICGYVYYESQPLVLYCQHGSNVVGAINNQSFIKRIYRNLGLIFKGNIFDSKTKWISSAVNQAKEVDKVLKRINIHDYDLYKFSTIKNFGFIYRKIMFLKNDWGLKRKKIWTAFWI